MAEILDESPSPRRRRLIVEAEEVLSDVFSFVTRPGDVVSVLTVFGLVLYASTWFIVDLYYDLYDVRPEEVGISYLSILTRLSVNAMWIIAIGLAIGLAWIYFLYWYKTLLGTTIARNTLIALLVIGVIITASVNEWVNLTPVWGLILTGLGLLLITYGATSLYTIQHWLSSESPSGSKLASRVFVWAGLALATFGLPFAFLTQLALSTNTDPLAYKGYAAQTLNIATPIVSLHWVQGKPPPNLSLTNSFTYLGSAGDIFIIYDLQTNKVFRISTQVAIIIHDKPQKETNSQTRST